MVDFVFKFDRFLVHGMRVFVLRIVLRIFFAVFRLLFKQDYLRLTLLFGHKRKDKDHHDIVLDVISHEKLSQHNP